VCFARFDLCIEVRLPDILDIPAWAIYQRRPPVKVVVAACCWLINKLPCVGVGIVRYQQGSVNWLTHPGYPGTPLPWERWNRWSTYRSPPLPNWIPWSLEHETTRTVTGRHSGEPNRPSDLKPGCV
jgi:hypothetical protein